MNSYLGIDTSNYTTSAAIIFENGSLKHVKKLLPVKPGALGLRQNEAVFHHVNRLPEIIEELLRDEKLSMKAIGVSSKPRDEENSYMPCFTVGVSQAKILSSFLKVPYYEFSHQSGHIMAAIYSAKRFDLLNNKFLAFHVSGGTTEAVLVAPDAGKIISTKIVGETLDLTAGQLIDRVGLMLGLNFPAGAELEKLALNYNEKLAIKPCVKGTDCCLSGVQNICEKMRENGEEKNKIAKVCIEYVCDTLDKMCENLRLKYGNMPVLFSGGVMANSIMREKLSLKYKAIFAQAEFSSDNAAGIAVLTKMRLENNG
ncbi:MAG: tRNA N6-adenosine threonylcarbamoyltransferase [Eubacteriales bacterium SKADARSKE-1]|nr:tRNA N6-adenosine threonylcarbamoyltransferase [Eubacteriales bacterium SKADARSKE-1]